MRAPEETGALTPGTYTVQVICMGHEAALAKVATATLLVVPELVYVEALISGLESRLKTMIDELRASLEETSESVEETKSGVGTATTLVGAAVGISVVSACLSGLASFLARKRP